MQAPSLTLGVEEEYQIIDPKTRELTSYITQILEADHRFLEQVKPELHQSIVEVGTKVCRTPAEVRTELVDLRGAVMELAARNGLKIAAAGTHPFSSWMKQEITPFLAAAQERGCPIQVGSDMLYEMIPAYLEFFGFGTATPEELRAVSRIG